MTLATATFQGMPYPVGSSYGRDIQFNPAVPADVQVTASLYVNSDAKDVRTIAYSGKATAAGLFGAAAGHEGRSRSMRRASTTRRCWRPTPTRTGTCGSASMRHAGVVYPRPLSRDRARQEAGHRRQVRRARRERTYEGYVDPDGTQHLAHITFPYVSGDVLLIGRRGPGREQDRAGAHLPDAGRHVGLGHQAERRRDDEPPDQDVERLLAAHVSRSTSPTSSTTTARRRGPASWDASSSAKAPCARPTGR